MRRTSTTPRKRFILLLGYGHLDARGLDVLSEHAVFENGRATLSLSVADVVAFAAYEHSTLKLAMRDS